MPIRNMERGSQPPPGRMLGAELLPPSIEPRPQAPELTFPSAPPRPTTESAGPKAAEPVGGPALDPDQVSVPAVDLDSGFFEHEPRFLTDSPLEIETRDPRALFKSTPFVIQRRARLAKYVTAAVGLASVLCATALLKNTIAGGHESLPRVAANRPTPSSAAPLSVNTEGTVERAPSPQEAPISVPTGSATAEGTAPAHPEPEASAAPEVAVLDPKVLAKEAGKEKAKARSALEWGKMGDAIEAGERSVAIDPTDGEAWLILGAAYQQKGDAKNAFRSFKACLDEGKRGPRNECAAMMR